MNARISPGSYALIKELLPKSVQVLAEKVGSETALQVVSILGGRCIRIPTGRGEAKYRLINEVGCPNIAAQLMQEYPERDIYFPRCDKALRALRNIEIASTAATLQEKGYSNARIIKELVAIYAMSDHSINNSLKKAQALIRSGQD